jgi:hypothetical protein
VLAQPAPLPEIITGPAVFAGDDACLTIGLLAGLRGLAPDRPLLIVDGANAFDPFLVSDLARKSGMAPADLLERIRISRVFTCHQLEALLRGRLQAAVGQFHAGAVYFSGPLDPLLDEDVSVGEARRIFRLLPPVLRRLSTAGLVTVCACPLPVTMTGREELFPALCETARWVFTVERAVERVADHGAGPRPGPPERDRPVARLRAGDPPGIRITCTKPAPGEWTWEPQIGLVVPRRWW